MEKYRILKTTYGITETYTIQRKYFGFLWLTLDFMGNPYFTLGLTSNEPYETGGIDYAYHTMVRISKEREIKIYRREVVQEYEL